MRGNEDAAREVLQETLLAAFRYLPGFRGDAAPSTWLYQIACSFCIKERRGGHPTRSLDDDGAPSSSIPRPSPTRGALPARSARPCRARSRCSARTTRGPDPGATSRASAPRKPPRSSASKSGLKSRLHRARMALRTGSRRILGTHDTAEPVPELAQELTAYVGAEIRSGDARADREAPRDVCAVRRRVRCAQRTVSLCRRLPGDVVPAPGGRRSATRSWRRSRRHRAPAAESFVIGSALTTVMQARLVLSIVIGALAGSASIASSAADRVRARSGRIRSPRLSMAPFSAS